MRNLYGLLLIVLFATGHLEARGWPAWRLFRSVSHDTNGCPVCCGCNDYLRKPFSPIVCPPGCPGPDDYWRKPCPSVPAVPHCGSPDDYCHKPYPPLCCPK